MYYISINIVGLKICYISVNFIHINGAAHDLLLEGGQFSANHLGGGGKKGIFLNKSQ